MYYGKMWCVVKPSVGLPLFFGAIATTSLLIHGAVLSHTTWYPAFYQGNAKTTQVAAAAAAPAAAAPAAMINVAPTPAPAAAPAAASPSVVINVGPPK